VQKKPTLRDRLHSSCLVMPGVVSALHEEPLPAAAVLPTRTPQLQGRGSLLGVRLLFCAELQMQEYIQSQ